MRKVLHFLFCLATFTSASVTDCSKGTSLFKVTSMSFSPDPIVSGQNSTLLLSMNVPEQIASGTASYALTYNFLPFTPSTDPLCSTVSCPIMTGTLSTSSSYLIPSGLSGSIIIKVTWTDEANRQLLCVSINTKTASNLNISKGVVVYNNKYTEAPKCFIPKNATFMGLLERLNKEFQRNQTVDQTQRHQQTQKLQGKKPSYLRKQA